jgi:hypothetical protein
MRARALGTAPEIGQARLSPFGIVLRVGTGWRASSQAPNGLLKDDLQQHPGQSNHLCPPFPETSLLTQPGLVNGNSRRPG